MAVRFGRSTPDGWSRPEIRTKAVNKTYRKRNGRIMFPTTHDITPENVDECLIVLGKLLQSGNDVLVVSKPYPDCIKKICDAMADYKKQIMFRFTIGSADDSILKRWEPNAPSFKERITALKTAYQLGYEISISCEPMLDTKIAKVISAVKPYVTDAIWLGRANRLRQIIAVNCPDEAELKQMADALLAEQTDDYLRDLYERYKNEPLIKFKDSIKKVAGLERPTQKGLDI